MKYELVSFLVEKEEFLQIFILGAFTCEFKSWMWDFLFLFFVFYSDSWTWIPKPAKRFGLWSHTAAYGHWN